MRDLNRLLGLLMACVLSLSFTYIPAFASPIAGDNTAITLALYRYDKNKKTLGGALDTDDSLSYGESFAVLVGTNADPISSFQIPLEYNRDILEYENKNSSYKKYDKGTGFGTVSAGIRNGVITVGGMNEGNVETSGSVLMYLIFKVKDDVKSQSDVELFRVATKDDTGAATKVLLSYDVYNEETSEYDTYQYSPTLPDALTADIQAPKLSLVLNRYDENTGELGEVLDESKSLRSDEYFVVSVVTDAAKVSAATIPLKYNKTIFEFQNTDSSGAFTDGVALGNMLDNDEGFVAANEDNGVIRMSYMQTDNSTGGDTLLQVLFRVKHVEDTEDVDAVGFSEEYRVILSYSDDESNAVEYSPDYDTAFMKRNIKNYTLGDVDDDGDITILDAQSTLYHSVGRRSLTGNSLLAADVNGDGDVNVLDAQRILYFSVGRIKAF